MDPTLADGDISLVVNHTLSESFRHWNIANEKRRRRQGRTHRQAGHRCFLEMHSIFDNILLYIQWKKRPNEPYLKDYISSFKDEWSTYLEGSENSGELFPPIGQYSPDFTVDKDGNPKFTLKLLDIEPPTWRWPDRFKIIPLSRAFKKREDFQIKGQKPS